MKKLVLILILCLSLFGSLAAQDNIWKPIETPGVFLGADVQGYLYAQNYNGLQRSQDEGLNWELVLELNLVSSNFIIGEEGRLFVIPWQSQTMFYSDDNGDTWEETSPMPYVPQTTAVTKMYSPSNETVVCYVDDICFWTTDGGATWNYSNFASWMEDPSWINDLIVNEAGDVYISMSAVGCFLGGIIHSTLNDGLENWTSAAFSFTSIFHMEFDPEGNVVAGSNWDPSMPIPQEPGFYLLPETREFVVADNGIIYCMRAENHTAVLAYSIDHGEHFTEIGEHLPLVDIVPGGDAYFIIKGHDNHLYFDGGGECWKTVINADEIISGQQNDLVLTPGVLTFEEPFVPQTFTISNQTDEAVTITSITVEPDDNMVLLDYSNLLPITLQPDESMDVEVELNGLGYKGYNYYYINVATSIGNRQVTVRVNEEAWDEGLQYIPMQGITFDGNTPLTQSFYLQNTNALQSITVYEISEYGTNYLEMVPAHSLPYEIPAGGFLEISVTLVNFPEQQTVTRAYCSSSQGEGAGYFFFIAGGLSNGGNGVHSLWKPINLPGTLLGANDQGYMFSTNYDSPQSLMRSHDDGETWETVLTGSIGNLTISNEGRIFVFSHNTMTVMYSDDNGDTWQQTSQISPCGMIDIPRLFATTNDIIVGWAQNGEIFWTLDGGDTWNGTILDFMEDHQEVSDLLVNENGDVYVSVWYYIGPNIGVYHSTLSDMQNWEIAAFEDVGIKDMAFDPEGNIVCGVNFGGEFSGFEHVPGFYAFWANRVGIADNGIVYKTAMTMYNRAVLAYSLDHGEHFYNTIEDLPVEEPIPGGEDGFLSKGHDNHLYFFGNGQYWKSIPNANDIPNVISFPSEWYYEIENENGSITYQYMYQAGDTIVQDEPTHILVRINTLYDKDLHELTTHEYVYMRDGKVYWWNKTLEEFTVLYDFGAQEGDSWVTKVGIETLIMHVNAVETVEYEDKTYRMLHVSDADGLFSGDIVCGIGHLTSFFPERLMDNGERMRVDGLRCYWVGEEMVFKIGDEDCDAIYSEVHGVEEDGPLTGLTVYPNPTNSVLFVQTLRATSVHDNTYRITNLMGQTVLTGSLNAEPQQIDVTGLAEGMYFVTVGNATRKFVVR